MPLTQPQQVLTLARSHGVLRARDLDPLRIPRTVLARLVEQGALVRVGLGLYVRSDAEITPHHALAQVAARVPGSVVNLLSALAFHELTDELPSAVWIAIRRGHHAPQLAGPRLDVTWTASRFLNLGVRRHTLEGVEVAITDPARTVADCFKYRSRVGVDVAVAALRDYDVRYRGRRDVLWEMAGACRMQAVLRPYLEALS
jgi:predicted transcriptional regulator of viral defense system